MQKVYAKAVKTLKPNKKRMAKIMDEVNETARLAKIEAEFRMRYTGKTALELYQEACQSVHSEESKLSKAIRVALLGMARKGL